MKTLKYFELKRPFVYEGRRYRAVKSTEDCRYCAFNNKGCNARDLICSGTYRSDRNSVIFKHVPVDYKSFTKKLKFLGFTRMDLKSYANKEGLNVTMDEIIEGEIRVFNNVGDLLFTSSESYSIIGYLMYDRGCDLIPHIL